MNFYPIYKRERRELGRERCEDLEGVWKGEAPRLNQGEKLLNQRGRKHGLREEGGVWCVGHGGRGVHVRER
jgi:hypothetical protein